MVTNRDLLTDYGIRELAVATNISTQTMQQLRGTLVFLHPPPPPEIFISKDGHGPARDVYALVRGVELFPKHIYGWVLLQSKL